MNSHGIPDMMYETQSICADLLPAVALSITGLTVPASSMTIAALAVRAYVRSGTTLVFVDQPAVSLTLSGAAGTYYIAVHEDLYTPVAGWSRRGGSHLIWGLFGSAPADPDGALVFASCTVTTVITAVTPLPIPTSQPMSLQRSGNVAITGGSAQLTALGLGTVANPAYPLVVGTGLQSWLNGPVGMGDAPNPAYILNAVGNIRVTGNGEVTGTERCAQLAVNGTPDGNVRAQITYNKTTDFGLKMRQTGTDTGGITLLFSNISDTAVGSITTTGSATAYNTSSDARLKRNIHELLGGVDVLKRMRPVSFVWKSSAEPDIGFLAHELMTVTPNAVQGLPDAVHPDGSVKPQQVDQSKIMPILVAGIKELIAQVEGLAARVAALEAR